MQEKKEFRYRITRIKDLYFEIKEGIAIDDNAPAAVNFQGNLQYFEEHNRVDFTIEVSFLFESSSNREPFMKGSVLTSFQVENLKDHIVSGQMFPLERAAMVTFLGLSITHARALVAKAAMGSKFQNYLIPIVNPSDLLDQMGRLPEEKQSD